jgi:hypothetical protein
MLANVLPLLDDRTLRSLALTSRAMRNEILLVVKQRNYYRLSHDLRCALMLRSSLQCVRCGNATAQFIRQHRLPHKRMCTTCLCKYLMPVPFETWLFLRRQRPYSCDRITRGGRVWRSPTLRLVG